MRRFDNIVEFLIADGTLNSFRLALTDYRLLAGREQPTANGKRPRAICLKHSPLKSIHKIA